MNFEIDFNNLSKMDLHMHTTFSDGNDSPADMLRNAAKMGMEVIGISDHSYTFFDESYCIPRLEVPSYIATVKQLKDRCLGLKDNPRFAKALGSDNIRLYMGIEQDYYSTASVEEYDYIIGSVHYVCLVVAEPKKDPENVPSGCFPYMNMVYIPVDDSPEVILAAVERYYNGDIYSFCEDYYKAVSDVVNKTRADIIGHFDLISKFNEGDKLFDSQNPRYVAAWKAAADELLKTDAVFEINTGAISRGYRTLPYPAEDMISYISQHGGKFIYSSDAHSKDNIGYGFDKL